MEVSLNCIKFEENELREKNLDLCIIPMDLDNLLANRDMWDFQLRLSSTKTPKKMVSETRGIKAARLWKHEIQTTTFSAKV